MIEAGRLLCKQDSNVAPAAAVCDAPCEVGRLQLAQRVRHQGVVRLLLLMLLALALALLHQLLQIWVEGGQRQQGDSLRLLLLVVLLLQHGPLQQLLSVGHRMPIELLVPLLVLVLHWLHHEQGLLLLLLLLGRTNGTSRLIHRS